MSGKSADYNKYGRESKLIKAEIHDPYQIRGKLSEPTMCPDCGVVYAEGHWQWMEKPPQNPHATLCPACKRIHDKVPAGYLTLSGPFYQDHHEEIMKLMHNHVEQQNHQYPLKRLMDIEVQKDKSTLITVTDHHLVSSIGKAVESAFQGDLEIQYTDESTIERVYWNR